LLRIHEDQMARLGRRAREGFVTRMVDYLASAYGERVGSDRARLEKWVETAIGKAERWGVTYEAPVAQFMLLLLVLGDDADEKLPWVHEALGDAQLSGLGKLRKVVREARARAVPDIEQVTVVAEVCDHE
jgi:hypothetical protein